MSSSQVEKQPAQAAEHKTGSVDEFSPLAMLKKEFAEVRAFNKRAAAQGYAAVVDEGKICEADAERAFKQDEYLSSRPTASDLKRKRETLAKEHEATMAEIKAELAAKKKSAAELQVGEERVQAKEEELQARAEKVEARERTLRGKEDAVAKDQAKVEQLIEKAKAMLPSY
ncbi:hypothetical protein BU23DRAFT_575443 [Bimuria novae-zelandiae CBS 107.79]|uniref:Uncharacterized protein n=1 Tax=Bimuria novae-zelandiae CBS 107.79 TaxID=1447943 RepID=A0A6A5UIX2_9PLEO|nr:hypothetical protein BU23DRAFT_575443 [Bimuria novae-zelandiae CBS 107.79]